MGVDQRLDRCLADSIHACVLAKRGQSDSVTRSGRKEQRCAVLSCQRRFL